MKPTDTLQIRHVTPPEIAIAAAVLGRGMRDNPLSVQAMGSAPAFREQALTGVFRAFIGLEIAKKGEVLGAFQDGRLVGVCGMMRPGCCQLAPGEKIALLPRLLMSCGVRGTGRLLAQFGAWSKRDLKEPHWHLGPVGIERELQGRGIGSRLLRAFCDHMDAEHSAAWLETDKARNVTFYKKFGFEVLREEPVNGTTNWYMQRKARPA